MSDANFKYLTEGISADIIGLIIKDRNLSLPNAVAEWFNSETYEKLCNSETELYVESAAYVYELYKIELSTGKFQDGTAQQKNLDTK